MEDVDAAFVEQDFDISKTCEKGTLSTKARRMTSGDVLKERIEERSVVASRVGRPLSTGKSRFS